jgi:hypothetical protein
MLSKEDREQAQDVADLAKEWLNWVMYRYEGEGTYTLPNDMNVVIKFRNVDEVASIKTYNLQGQLHSYLHYPARCYFYPKTESPRYVSFYYCGLIARANSLVAHVEYAPSGQPLYMQWCGIPSLSILCHYNTKKQPVAVPYRPNGPMIIDLERGIIEHFNPEVIDVISIP